MTTGRTRLHKDTYLDSVRLLAGSKAMLGVPGVEQATALMGTPANLAQLASDGFDAGALTGAGANDLLLAVRAGSPEAAEAALARAEQELLGVVPRWMGRAGRRPGRDGPRDHHRTAPDPRRGAGRPAGGQRRGRLGARSLCRARGAQGAVGGAARPAVQRQRAGRGRGGAQGQGGRAGPAADGPGRRHGDAGRGRARVRQRGLPGPRRHRRRGGDRRPGGDEPARPVGGGRRPGARGGRPGPLPGGRRVHDDAGHRRSSSATRPPG